MKTLDVCHLADKTKPWGVISFIHSDGREHKFWTAVNKMSGSRLSAFDSNPPDIDESLAYIKTVFRDIRKRAKVTGFNGSKQFKETG
jgi:hypothetical protein